MLPSPNPEMSAVPSMSAGHGLDLFAVVADHDVIVLVESVMVGVGERHRVILDESLVLFDAEETVAHGSSVGRAGLVDRQRRELHRVIRVGYADGRAHIPPALDVGIFR